MDDSIASIPDTPYYQNVGVLSSAVKTPSILKYGSLNATETYVRFRPMLRSETQGENGKTNTTSSISFHKKLKNVLLKEAKPIKYDFDHVFPMRTKQSAVYDKIGKSKISTALIEGRQVAMVAFGPSKSGKSYSLIGKSGNVKEYGILLNVIQSMFEEGNKDITLSISSLKNDEVEELIEQETFSSFDEMVHCIRTTTASINPEYSVSYELANPQTGGIAQFICLRKNEWESLKELLESKDIISTSKAALHQLLQQCYCSTDFKLILLGTCSPHVVAKEETKEILQLLQKKVEKKIAVKPRRSTVSFSTSFDQTPRLPTTLDLQKNLHEKNAQLLKMEETVKASKVDQHKITYLEETLKQMTLESEAQAETFQQKIAQFEACESTWKQQMQEIQENMQKLEDENEKLKKLDLSSTNEKNKVEMQQQEKDAYEQRIQDLLAKHDDQIKEINKNQDTIQALKAKLATVDQQKEDIEKAHQQEVQALKKKEQLKEQQQQVDKEKQIEEKTKMEEDHEAALATLQDDLKKEQQRVVDLQKEDFKEQLQSQKKAFEEQLSTQKASFEEQLASQKESFEVQKEALEKQITEQTTKEATHDAKLNQKVKEHDDLVQKCSQLENKLSKQEEALNDAKRKNEELEKSMEEQRNEFKQQIEQMVDVNELKNEKEQNEQLKDQLKKVQIENEVETEILGNNLEKAKVENQHLQDQLTHLKREVERKRSDDSQWKDKEEQLLQEHQSTLNSLKEVAEKEKQDLQVTHEAAQKALKEEKQRLIDQHQKQLDETGEQLKKHQEQETQLKEQVDELLSSKASLEEKLKVIENAKHDESSKVDELKKDHEAQMSEKDNQVNNLTRNNKQLQEEFENFKKNHQKQLDQQTAAHQDAMEKTKKALNDKLMDEKEHHALALKAAQHQHEKDCNVLREHHEQKQEALLNDIQQVNEAKEQLQASIAALENEKDEFKEKYDDLYERSLQTDEHLQKIAQFSNEKQELIGKIKQLIYHVERMKVERSRLKNQNGILRDHVQKKNAVISQLYSKIQDEAAADFEIHQSTQPSPPERYSMRSPSNPTYSLRSPLSRSDE
mmetsp:Transcript_7422/g.10964  ORF Transcript_7422/g.10964 Transcript_7422/m.10964 type:complete len:1075 (+) Transcript_7422:1160-4384(+)